MTPFAFRDRFVPRAVTFGLSLTLWLFGLSTSMLLIGLWGRSVAGDEVTLEAGTRAVLESEIVNDRVSAWVGDAVATAGQLSSRDTAAAIRSIGDSPEMQAALDDIIDQAVAAALAPPGTATEIDVTAAVDSLVPVIGAALEAEGIAVDAATIRGAAGDVPAIVLSAEDQGVVSNAAREVGGLLSTVVVAALVGIVATGAAAMKLSGDYVRQLRVLAVRIGVSAITFAFIIRIGAWAVDPAGGRSPIRAGSAVLLRSNGHIMAIVTGAAAAIAIAASMIIVRRRNSQKAGPDSEEHHSTGELPVLVGAGG